REVEEEQNGQYAQRGREPARHRSRRAPDENAAAEQPEPVGDDRVGVLAVVAETVVVSEAPVRQQQGRDQEREEAQLRVDEITESRRAHCSRSSRINPNVTPSAHRPPRRYAFRLTPSRT